MSRRLMTLIHLFVVCSLLLGLVPPPRVARAASAPGASKAILAPFDSAREIDPAAAPAQQTKDAFTLTLKATPRRIPADGVSQTSIWVKGQDEEKKTVPEGATLSASTTLGKLLETQSTTKDGVGRFVLVAGRKTGTAIVTVRAGETQQRIAVELVAPGDLGARISDVPDTSPFNADEQAETARHPVTVDGEDVARAEGESYALGFDGAQMTFNLKAWQAKNERQASLDFTLLQVTVGQRVLFDSRGARRARANARANEAFSDHSDALRQVYVALDAGVEQSFILQSPPESAPYEGDLVIEGRLRTSPANLKPHYLSDEQGVVFLNQQGYATLAYGGAVVRDDLGRETVARLRLDNNRITLTVPGEWLARAAYPVIVDPLIGHPSQVGYGWGPALAYNSDDDEWLAVWRRSGSDMDLYGRRVGSDGTPSGDSFGIVTVSGLQQAPDVAYNPSAQQYLVVWQDSRTSGEWRLYGQRVAADGTLAGPEIAINAAPYYQLGPSVAYQAATGEWLVVWHGQRPDGIRVYGQRIDASGALVGSDLTLSQEGYSHNGQAVAADSNSGAYLAVWQMRTSSFEYQLRARRLSSAGTPLGDEVPFASTSSDSYWPQVAYNAQHDAYLAVWEDDRNGDWDIYAQRFAPDGTPLGEHLALQTMAGDQYYSRVSGQDPSGRYLVVWEGDGVEGQWLAADGALDGETLILAPNGESPDLAYGSQSQQFLLAYEEGDEVYAVRYTVDAPGTSCNIYKSSDVPKDIPLNPATINSVLEVGESDNIVDVDVILDVSHTWVGDLSVTLSHQGTDVTIIDRPGRIGSGYGCSGDGINATLDDEATSPVEDQCAGTPPAINGAFSPNEPLSAFDDQEKAGAWTLTVQDWVQNDGGALNGWSLEICTESPAPSLPVADFSATPTSGDAPLQVAFTNLSSGATGYQWSFGDGLTNTLTNPTHTYTQTGSFTVILTATAGSESDVEVKTDYISVTSESPVTVTADFVATPSSGDAPLAVVFTNLSSSSGELENYQWSFGDGRTSTLENPAHVYTQTGSFTVILTATAGSASDVAVKSDYISATEAVPVIVAAPVVTITTPDEGAVLGDGAVQVSGVVSDDGTVVGVWVDEVTATLDGDAFSATVVLTAGNQVINVEAQDDQGVFGFAGRVVRVDGDGPMVEIHLPHDRQAVYTLYPTATVSYTDFYTAVNTATFSATLTADEGTVTDVSANFSVNADGATGDLGGPLDEDATYTLTVSIADGFGHTGEDSNTLYVPPGAGGITPPAAPEGAGWVSGRVYDSSTCNDHLTTCQGLSGVQVTVRPIDHATRALSATLTGTVLSGPDGFYAFPVDATGTFALRFEKDGYTYGQREVSVVRAHSTPVDDLYLTPLDTATTVISYPLTQTVVHTSTDEMMVVEIPPGALAPGQVVSVTATNFEQVEFLPSGDLPPGTWETYAFNLGGDSEVRFTRPITVRLSNYRNFAPGTQIPLGYWNQETLSWEHAGVGTVDESGEWMVMHVLHFSNFDCNDPVTPPDPGGGPEDGSGDGDPCPEGEEGCFISLKSGRVREWIDLPPVNVLGQSVAPTLIYNTNRADPAALIDVRLDLYFDPLLVETQDYIQFELYIEGQKTDRFTFAADLDGEGQVGRYRYLWDGRDARGERLPPGVYAYAVKLSMPYTGQWYWSRDGRFGGPPDPDRPTGVFVNATQDYWTHGTVALNPQPESALGEGWILKDQQRVIEDEAGRVVVIDGDRLDEYYFDLADQLDGLPPAALPEPPVTGPRAALPIPSLPTAGAFVSGTLSADTTWTSAASPYVVTGADVIVAPGVTLTVEPGVTVMLDQYQNLVVSGTLSAVGTLTQPITLTAYHDGDYRYWRQFSTYDSEWEQTWSVDAIGAAPNGDVWFVKTLAGEGFEAIAERVRANSTLRDTFEMPLESGTWAVPAVAVDSAGQKWFATDAGVLMLAADDVTWTPYDTGDGLASNTVNDVEVDGDDNVWFATDAGVSRRTPGGVWTSYDTGDGLASNWVNAVAVDADGNLWFGTYDGLSRRTPGGVWTTFDSSNSDILSDEVVDVSATQGGDVWTAHWGGVSARLAAGGWLTFTTENSGLASAALGAVAVDATGVKWIGYDDAGASLLSADNTNWTHVSPPTLGDESVRDIAVTASGAVWLANGLGGVMRSTYSADYDGVISGGHWGTLRISPQNVGGGEDPIASAPSRLRYVTLEMGGVGGQSTLYLQDTAPTLDHLTIRGGGGDGLHVYNVDNLALYTATIESNEGTGIYIEGGYGGHTLAQVDIQYNGAHGLQLDHPGDIAVISSTLAHNSGYGLFTLHANNALTLAGSAVHDNAVAARLAVSAILDGNDWADNERQELEWLGGTLNGDRTWSGEAFDALVMLDTVTVGEGVTLTVTPGTEMWFEDGWLNVYGVLSAVGTRDAPIRFAGSGETLPTYRLRIGGGEGDSDRSHLSYAVIQGAYYGLYLQNSAPTLDHLSLVNNTTGLYVNNSGGLTITASNFANNQNYGIYNNTPSQVVDAANNYWNAESGPYHFTLNPSGSGDAVSDGVTFGPWEQNAQMIAGLRYVLVKRTPTDHSTLTFDPDSGTDVRVYPDGRPVYFNPDGSHDYSLDPDGRRTVYTYNGDGTVATLGIVAPGESDPRWTWTFSYSGGLLTGVTDPAGRTTTATVDEHGHLSQVSFPDGEARRFYYDARGLMTQQVDGAGHVTDYVYDAYGRLTQHLGPQRTVYDPQTGATTAERELKTFTPGDSAYPLINEGPLGDPDTPAPAVLTSTLIVDGVSYGRGGRSGHTNQWGKWLDETDALGRTITYIRDAANNVTGITFPDGSCIEAEYDANGHAISAVKMDADQCALAPEERDPDLQQRYEKTHETRFDQVKTLTTATGQVITYTYDYELGLGEAGKLVRVEYPPVRDENGVLVTPVVSYTYNSLGQRETETDFYGTLTRYAYTQGSNDEAHGQPGALFAPGVTPVPGLLTQIIQDDGGYDYATIYKDFDALGNAQTVVYPGNRLTTTYAYDDPSTGSGQALGRVITETNAEGIVTLYAYDARGQVVRSVADYTPDGVTGDNVVTTYEYDADGRLIHQRTEADGLVAESFSRYDVNGQLVSELDGRGNETRYIYDEVNQLVQTIDPAGHSTFYTYTNGLQLETATGPEGHVTRNIYDEFGRLKQLVQAEGELDLTTTYTYTLDGLPLAMEAPDGTVTCFEYDTLKRRIKTIQDCREGGLNLTTRYAYDVLGNTVYVTDTRGIRTYYEYDALGRVTLTRQDDGGLNLETHTTFDAAGNVSTTVGPDGTVTRYLYDEMNRLLQVCQDASGLNLCTSYTYDRRGRQETVTDANGVVQRTVYNTHGLPVQEIADADGLAATTSFEYDALLRLFQVTDSNGNATHYTYTPRGSVESELYADGSTVHYTYDPRGNVATLTLADGAVITRTYDAANRQQQADFSTPSTGSGQGGGFQAFQYDSAGRLTQATQTLDGHTTVNRYGYSAVGDVVSTTQQLDGGSAWLTQYANDYVQRTRTITYPSGTVRVYQMDSLNRLDAVETGDSTLIADYAYDVANHFNTLAYANGLSNRVDYNTLGWTTRVSSAVADYRYGYDAVGNRTYMQRYHQPGQPFDVYEYDGLYQLVNVWYGTDAATPAEITSYDSAQSYDLDLLGNRLEVTEDGETEAYGPNDGAKLTHPLNRYESVDDLTLDYDPRGNTLDDGINTYVYDVLNRQTGVSGPGGTAEYVYDARGRRVAKIVNGVTIHYVYDTRYRVIEERDDDEVLLARYTYGSGMDEPLTMERGGETYYYHRDALGSITEVTDDAGDLVERYEYDVYGAVTIFDGAGITLTASAIGNPYLFTARRYDPESGNYTYRARMYSPWLGRFLSMDPLGFDAGDYNLYRYVFNNPVNYADPTGEFAFIPWLAKASAEAAADALMQAAIAYFFDPSVTSVSEAIGNVDLLQVGGAFLVGLLPFGGLGKAVLEAAGEVVLNALEALGSECKDYTNEQALFDFASGIVFDLAGDKIADLIVDYGLAAVKKGLKKLGVDDVIELIGNALFGCSFSEDTLVTTIDGLEAINALEVDDVVLAYDEATGQIGYYPIIGVWIHEDPIVVRLTIDGELIETTPEHPFYTTEDQWVTASDLQVSDEVRRVDGDYGIVQAVEFVHQSQSMYNLTVADAHTYFVGNGQWLVHNKCGSIWTPNPKKGLSPVENAYTHWKKHRLEFPELKNAKQYVDAVHNFVNSSPVGTLTKTRPNGDVLFYHPGSNTFAIKSASGPPRTMFRPDEGIDYWNAQ